MKTIKWKLITATGAMLILVCAALGMMAVLMSSSVIKADIEKNIEGKAVDIAHIVSINITKELAILEQIATRTRISNADNPMEDRLAALSEDFKRIGYLRLAFVDMAGLAHYTDGTTADLAERGYVKKALEGTSNISDTLISKVDGSVIMAFAVPVKNGDKVMGAIVAIRPGEFVSQSILNSSIGGSSYAFLVSDSGIIQAHKDPEMVKSQYNILEEAKKDPKAAALAEIMERAVNGETGNSTYWFMGIDKFMGYAPVENSNWAAAMTIPENEVMAPVKKLEMMLFGITAGLIMLGLAGAWFMGTQISVPIVAATAQAQTMAQGDFTQDVPESYLSRKDEIGKLAHAYKEMTGNFRVLIGTVVTLAQQVAAASEQLTAVSEQVNASSNEISRSVEEIAEGATDQAKETENGAHQAADLGELIDADTEKLKALESASSEISSRVHEGLKAVDVLQKKADETQSATQAISEGINLTNDSSRRIGEASNMISTIADQTNLLALNAAIEAARAGEHGRGFAVVAEEIRKLAEQSTESTRTIDNMVSELRKNSQDSVKTMEQVTGAIAEQLSSVRETEAKYKEISGSVEGSLVLIRNLSASSQQMSHNKDKIVEVMAGLSAIAEENAASTEEVAAGVHLQTASIEEIAHASKSLAELAQELTEASARFRI